jgi:hypothetical protein
LQTRVVLGESTPSYEAPDGFKFREESCEYALRAWVPRNLHTRKNLLRNLQQKESLLSLKIQKMTPNWKVN